MDNQKNESFGFQPISKLDLKRKGTKVLVTNNLDSRDAYGQRSHIWIVDMVFYKDGEYYAYTERNTKIYSITHFCELP